MLSQSDEIRLRQDALSYSVSSGMPPTGVVAFAQELFLFMRGGLPTGSSDTAVLTL